MQTQRHVSNLPEAAKVFGVHDTTPNELPPSDVGKEGSWEAHKDALVSGEVGGRTNGASPLRTSSKGGGPE